MGRFQGNTTIGRFQGNRVLGNMTKRIPPKIPLVLKQNVLILPKMPPEVQQNMDGDEDDSENDTNDGS